MIDCDEISAFLKEKCESQKEDNCKKNIKLKLENPPLFKLGFATVCITA